MIRRDALLALAALAAVLPGCHGADDLIESDLAADDRWVELQAQLERRLALAAQLAAAIKAASPEDPGLPALNEARSRAHLEATMVGDDLTDPMKVAALVKAEGALRAELSRALAPRAALPAFRELGAQLAAAERAVAGASDAYDRAAQGYAAALVRAPEGAMNRLTGRRFRPRVPLAR
jgi:LemA protein